ncbi:MAG: hypothetical protein CMJ78_18050 [Planctomycetaceae bacterium]|nr:hypothetical protein [Planctomycetaceae bacterium]
MSPKMVELDTRCMISQETVSSNFIFSRDVLAYGRRRIINGLKYFLVAGSFGWALTLKFVSSPGRDLD